MVNMASDIRGLIITEDKKRQYIERLVDELPVLRTMLGASQDELASTIGLSRQTYSAIETRKRKMTWSVYLSLILIFDCCKQTHDLMRNKDFFPEYFLQEETADQRNEGSQILSQFGLGELKDNLDDQALHSIETIIMIEYARCNHMSGKTVVKAFDGKQFSQISERDIAIQKALNKLKK